MKTLIDENQLQDGIRRFADEIGRSYTDKPLTLVGVRIASVLVLADLIRLLDMPLRVELLKTRRYQQDDARPGPLAIDLALLSTAVKGRNVLLVDDIFDTGHTLWELIPQVDELGPTSVRTAVFLRKQDRSEVSLKPDFVAFNIPNEFVVGYGLHYRDQYRNLPYVAALTPEERAEELNR